MNAEAMLDTHINLSIKLIGILASFLFHQSYI